MGEVIRANFGGEREEPPVDDTLRKMVEKQQEVARGESLAEGFGKTFETWLAELERGNTDFVIKELRQAAPVLKEVLAMAEGRDATGETINLLKWQREAFHLRAIVFREVLGNEAKAQEYDAKVGKIDRQLESVADLLNPRPRAVE